MEYSAPIAWTWTFSNPFFFIYFEKPERDKESVISAKKKKKI